MFLYAYSILGPELSTGGINMEEERVSFLLRFKLGWRRWTSPQKMNRTLPIFTCMKLTPSD